MTWSDWSLAFFVASWTISLGMIPVVVTRKEHPTTCLAWLMIVFFVPWLGLGLYLLFGEDRLVRRRLQWREETGQRFGELLDGVDCDLDNAQESQRDDHSGEPLADGSSEANPVARHLAIDVEQKTVLARLGRAAGGLPLTDGNSLELMTETRAVIDRLIEDIDAARDHIHLLFYIYEVDKVGRRVADALKQARERKVECRVLVDAVGSWSFSGALAAELRAAGIEVATCLPVGLMRRRLARIDLRNHRKLAIIDGSIAWTGSQNIVEDTYGHRTAGRWCDVMARITGPAVRQFQMTFFEDWHSETQRPVTGGNYFPKPSHDGQVTLQVVPSGPDRPSEDFQALIIEAINSARQQITITSPYFIPDDALLFALRLAAARGVQVDVIIPRRSDHSLVDAATAFYLGYLLHCGVRFFRFTGGLLHAKTMTVDDSFGLFGSANFDVRSFHLNFEINVSLFDEHAVRELRWVQDHYRSQSTEVSREDWERRSRWSRFKANLAKLLSPIL
ncbi:cardiolipin synthase [bacterium]|nr:cardiolipin synthase [bacterium]